MSNRLIIGAILLAALQTASCSAHQERFADESGLAQAYYFLDMYSPTAVSVMLDGEGHGHWAMSIDAGNTAKSCINDAYAFCLQLTDLWTLAIPVEIKNDAMIGTQWAYLGTHFSLDEKLHFEAPNSNEVILLVSAESDSRRVVFHYHATKGILAFFTLSPGGMETDEYGWPYGLWLSEAIVR